MSFEEALPIINELLSKNKHKWLIKALPWLSWEDVEQIIRLHIFKKFHLFDQKQKLEPWANMIINNQMINLSRNVYLSMERPCLQNGGCAFNEGNDHCSFTPSGNQCSECPLYAKWEKTKKHSHNINLPLSLVNHEQEVFDIPTEDVNLDKAILQFNEKIKEKLTKIEYKIYHYIYIQHLSDLSVAEKMGYLSNEKNRKAGYATILRIKKKIWKVANEIKHEIDFI